MLTVGSLFAGIGGIELGLESTGEFKVVWQVENDPFANRVLEKHWPDVVRWDDVRTFPPNDEGWNIDVLSAGFPCQDISVAGKGIGLEGNQSGLFFEVMRIAQAVRPKFILLENVSALLVRGLDEVLRSLAEIGFDAQWDCIPASAVGAPHRRDRIFIVAYSESVGIQRLRKSKKQISSAYARPKIPLRGSTRERRHLWQVEPRVGRVVNGFPKKLDRGKRIKALGNAVVPQVAELIGWSILEWQEVIDSKKRI